MLRLFRRGALRNDPLAMCVRKQKAVWTADSAKPRHPSSWWLLPRKPKRCDSETRLDETQPYGGTVAIGHGHIRSIHLRILVFSWAQESCARFVVIGN